MIYIEKLIAKGFNLRKRTLAIESEELEFLNIVLRPSRRLTRRVTLYKAIT